MNYPTVLYKVYDSVRHIVRCEADEIEYRARGYKTHKELLALEPEPEVAPVDSSTETVEEPPKKTPEAFEAANPGKKAIFRGRQTKAYKAWTP